MQTISSFMQWYLTAVKVATMHVSQLKKYVNGLNWWSTHKKAFTITDNITED
jgi:hypothetical protein